jgi:hypothetical protein
MRPSVPSPEFRSFGYLSASHVHERRVAALGLAVALGAFPLACERPGPLEVNGVETHSTSITVGQTLGIRLRTNGPGEYLSPPTLSDSALEFLGDGLDGLQGPGGPTQLFRFKAVARGRSIVTFQHSDGAYAVSDTVIVQ